MQNLSKLILEKYQVRKTKEQKTQFIELLQKELQGYDVRVEQGGMFKSRNIVVGNLETCDVVLGAHYDTAPELPFPNFLAPKNILAYLAYTFLIVLAFMVVMAIGVFVGLLLTDNVVIIMLIEYGIMFLLLGCMMFGKANIHTANDNTSGVITLIEALHDDNIKDKVCCVFFDHEEVGLFGSSFFANKHKNIMKDKLLINFDCVSDGDTIMLVVNKNASVLQNKIEESFISEEDKKFFITKSSTTLYPSDQMNFKKNIGVAVFKRNKLIGYYMDRIHTRKDVIFEERNIEMIIKGLKKFVN